MYKKVLITGAEGFIGSHLTEFLLNKKYKIRATSFYNFMGSNGWLDKINLKKNKNIEIIQGDITDEKFARSITKNIDAVINLSALIGIPYSYKSPKSYINNNVIGTHNLLESSVGNKVKKFIQTSTSEVYGNASSFPITENFSLKGNSPYSASKIASDQLSFSYYSSFDLPVLIARPFNVYGPRQSQRAIIPTLINQIIKSKNNGYIEVGNISPRREFNYVSDICEGFLSSIKLKNNGQVINIGNGYDVSIKDLTQIIARLMNKNIKLKVNKKRIRPSKSEVMKLRASFKKQKNY